MDPMSRNSLLFVIRLIASLSCRPTPCQRRGRIRTGSKIPTLLKGSFTGKVAFSCKLKLLRIRPIYSVFVYIGVGILYPRIGVIHRYDDTKNQYIICYGHKSVGN